MNTLKPAGPLDEASLPDGDVRFVGVDERLEPQQLAAGYVAAAKNYRFRRGKIEPRNGITILPWLKGNGLTPFTEVYGGFVYQDPNQGGEWIVIAADGGVWRTRVNAAAQAVPLPTGLTLTRDTFKRFIQANSAIVLLLGLPPANATDAQAALYTPLVCTDLTAGFMAVQQENQWEVQLDASTNLIQFPASNVIIGDPVQFSARPAPKVPNPDYTYALPAAVTAGKTYYVVSTPNADTFGISATPGGTALTWNTSDTDATLYDATITLLDGAVPIAPAADGVFFQNRLILVTGKDTLLVSDIGDFTRYQPTTNTFRINEGDPYTIEKIYIFNEDTLVVGKDGNMMKVTGVSGDLTQAQGPLNVTQAYGIVAPSFGDLGKDLFWLNSEHRITSLNLTALNQEQGTSDALSDPLVQTFGRINPAAIARARLTIYDSYLLCALPLDDAQLVDPYDHVMTGFNPGSTTDTRPRYDIAGHFTVTGLTAGRSYQYRQGPAQGAGGDLSVVNGTETLAGDADLVAQGNTVTLTGTPGDFVYASLKWIQAQQVNTAVAVYDFIQSAWAGSDEADFVVCPVDWLKFTYAGRQVLAFIGADGFLHLYNDGFEDEQLLPVTAPYTDILIESLPDPGPPDNIYVLTDTMSTAAWAGVAPWDTSTLANAQATLAAALKALPSSGQLVIESIAGGARVSSPPFSQGGTNYPARLPQVQVDGATVTNGKYLFTFLDSHSGSEIQPRPIPTDVTLRGYMCRPLYGMYMGQQSLDVKRYTSFGLQLATWAPAYTLFTRTQGQGDETQYAPDPASGISAVTRDYTQYFAPFDKGAWTVSNANDDFNAPGRQDYAYPETGAGVLLGSGINFDAEQQFVHRVAVSDQGLYLQVRLQNNGGRVSILAAAMEAQSGQVLSGLEMN